MRPLRRALSAATAAALALSLVACSDDAAPRADAKPDSVQNAAVGQVFQPSDRKGGTLRFGHSSVWDSLDPADTYYGYSWNFARNYGRALTQFNPAPGAKATEVIPDLAESLGRPSTDLQTWTYTLKKGVKFEDGTPVTSRDVKYAVERSLDKETFPNGPTYLNDVLDTTGYVSPYKEMDPNKAGLRSIETPDDSTIVFRLRRPFAGFDQLAMLPATIPVPRAKDTGKSYRDHVVSTGPYMFETVAATGFTMVRNPHWESTADPTRKALPERIEVALNVPADDLDGRLISGDLHVAVEGSGVGAQAQERIQRDPALTARSDRFLSARLWYAAVNPDVIPNLECRKAIEYAVDKSAYQRAYGGPDGGEIATSMLPPVIPGHQKLDLYPSGPGSTGDLDKARQALQACGQPAGFATTIAYREGRSKEQAAAESLQQSLSRVGIQATPRGFPQGDYFRLYAGNPAFAKANNLGLLVTGWAADWPDGYAFLSQIVDSRVVREAGNTNLSVKVPAVDALIDQALNERDKAKRDALWGQVDRTVMEQAVTVPGVYARGLLFRPPNLTNVFVTDAFQMYDYASLGVQ